MTWSAFTEPPSVIRDGVGTGLVVPSVLNHRGSRSYEDQQGDIKMTRNALTPSTPSNPVRDGVARSGRYPVPTPVPPLRGDGLDGAETAGHQEGQPRPESTMTRCAYPRCQAGGDILEGAPVMSELVIFDLHTLAIERVDEYHPGCWAAELHAEGTRS